MKMKKAFMCSLLIAAQLQAVLAAAQDKKEEKKAEVPDFGEIDENRDGVVDRREAKTLERTIARALGVENERVSVEFDAVDSNDDGVIDLLEYQSLKRWYS